MRVVYNDVEDLAQLIPDLTEEEKKTHDYGSYTADAVLRRHGPHHAVPHRSRPVRDPDHAQLRDAGVAAQERRASSRRATAASRTRSTAARYKFWGGLAAETWGGGAGLVDNEHKACEREGIKIFYETPALSLLTDDDGKVLGVQREAQGQATSRSARRRWCSRAAASSRTPRCARATSARAGTSPRCAARATTPGLGIKMALDIGAMPYGHWSGCHAVGWDRNAPPFGDVNVGDQFQKHSYPWGIMINANGERFVDEGADFRNYTYAKYGRVILKQPGMFAWQVFDQKIIPMLRDEYRIKQVTKVRANTLEELCKKMEGVNAERCAARDQGIQQGGAARQAVQHGDQGRPPHARASRSTRRTGRTRIDEPPFEAYAVTCGVTFSFGGLKITNDARSRGHRRQADSRALRGGRAGRRHLLSQLSGRHRAHLRLRCSARSPATAPRLRQSDVSRQFRREPGSSRMTCRSTSIDPHEETLMNAPSDQDQQARPRTSQQGRMGSRASISPRATG